MVLIEDIRPGLELPTLVVTPTSRRLVLWAAAVGDFYEAHYDLEYAKAHKLPGVIVHGTLKLALLSKAVSTWAGPDCFVRRVSATYRGMDLVNQPFSVKGQVMEVAPEGDLLVVTVRLTGVSADDSESTLGMAVVDLPRPGRG